LFIYNLLVVNIVYFQQHTQQQQLSEQLQLLQATPSAAAAGGGAHTSGQSTSSSAAGQNLANWQRPASVSGLPSQYQRQHTAVSSYAGLQMQHTSSKAG